MDSFDNARMEHVGDGSITEETHAITLFVQSMSKLAILTNIPTMAPGPPSGCGFGAIMHSAWLFVCGIHDHITTTMR